MAGALRDATIGQVDKVAGGVKDLAHEKVNSPEGRGKAAGDTLDKLNKSNEEDQQKAEKIYDSEESTPAQKERAKERPKKLNVQ